MVLSEISLAKNNLISIEEFMELYVGDKTMMKIGDIYEAYDRAKSKILRISAFGIIEMTRQRMRPSLQSSTYLRCPHCDGTGLIKNIESM